MQQEILNGFRLSQQQARLWAVQGDNASLCAQAAVQIEGQLDVDALQSAIQKVVAKHEILRTNFSRLPGMPLPVQVVAADHVPVLARLSNDEMVYAINGRAPVEGAYLRELCQLLFMEEQRRIVDLSQDKAVHSSLFILPDGGHLLLLTLPALCADGWSLCNLVREIADAYAAQTEDADDQDGDDEVLQYAQFAEWQHEQLADDGSEEEDEERTAGLAYWAQQSLNDALILTLPYQRQSADTSRREPDSITTQLSNVSVAQLNAVADSLDTTVASLLFACWQTLLWHVSGQADFVIGETSDGRPHEMLHDLLGLFAGTLPIRCRLDANLRVRDLVGFSDQARNDAEAWQDYVPWHEIVPPAIGFELLPPEQSVQSGAITLSICQQRVLTDRFALKLICQPGNDLFSATVEYDPACFQPQEMTRLLGYFGNLLHDAVQDVDALLGDLELLDEADRQQLLVEFNDTTAEIAQEPCWHERFALQAADTPDAVALVVDDANSLTYDELNQRANQLAYYLQAQGVGSDVPVGLCMARSPEMIVGLLAILKAGGAYLPLDPMYPLERLAFTLNSAKSPFLLTQSTLFDRTLVANQQDKFQGLQVLTIDTMEEILAEQPTTNPVSGASAENLAYVIYTSGSTGRPKGVMIRHGAVMNLAAALRESLYIAPEIYGDAGSDRPQRVSLNAPITFDSSVKQLVQLCYGHTLVLIPEEVRPDGEALRAFAHKHEVDVLDCTPPQLRLLLEAGLGEQNEGEQGRGDPALVLVGGEAIDAALWAQLINRRGTLFYNVYGPTECTVDATSCAIRLGSNEPTIGQPLSNTQLYILDERLRPVPLGTPGELYIGGAGLARGYLNAPELTAERFVPNLYASEPGARLYRTGDLAAYQDDGNVLFYGRADHQVKLRGFRIELGEIEAVLSQHPTVREAVVIVREDVKDDQRLVAYVVESRHVSNGSTNGSADDASASPPELRTFLRTKLPEYMIPSSFVTLKELPLTRNGKVDRHALPAPESVRPTTPRNFVAPRNQNEQTIAQIWQEVLRVDKVGADDNFFDLGGHSLLMVEVYQKLSAFFERKLSLMDMFRNPTVTMLAQYLNQDQPTGATIDQAQKRGEYRKSAGDKRRKRREKRSKVHA